LLPVFSFSFLHFYLAHHPAFDSSPPPDECAKAVDEIFFFFFFPSRSYISASAALVSFLSCFTRPHSQHFLFFPARHGYTRVQVFFLLFHCRLASSRRFFHPPVLAYFPPFSFSERWSYAPPFFFSFAIKGPNLPEPSFLFFP